MTHDEFIDLFIGVAENQHADTAVYSKQYETIWAIVQVARLARDGSLPIETALGKILAPLVLLQNLFYDQEGYEEVGVIVPFVYELLHTLVRVTRSASSPPGPAAL